MLKLEYLGFAKEVLDVQGLLPLIDRVANMALPNARIANVINRSSSKYRVFLDIGAAFGQVTAKVSSKFSQCFCFEPSEGNYKELLKTLERRKLTNVTPYRCALGSKPETREFSCSPDNPYDNRFAADEEERFTTHPVDVVRLDDVCSNMGINEPCAIKIDVQGYELEVMRGAVRLLAKRCYIISEFWPWGMCLHKTDPFEYIAFMQGMGYSFFNLNGKPASEEYMARLCKLGRKRKHVWDDFLIKHPCTSEEC
jgi:FkbM family methyltransferase